jgi:hypothetical protein
MGAAAQAGVWHLARGSASNSRGGHQDLLGRQRGGPGGGGADRGRRRVHRARRRLADHQAGCQGAFVTMLYDIVLACCICVPKDNRLGDFTCQGVCLHLPWWRAVIGLRQCAGTSQAMRFGRVTQLSGAAQALRRTLGWFLVAVAVLVPLKVTAATC